MFYRDFTKLPYFSVFSMKIFKFLINIYKFVQTFFFLNLRESIEILVFFFFKPFTILTSFPFVKVKFNNDWNIWHHMRTARGHKSHQSLRIKDKNIKRFYFNFSMLPSNCTNFKKLSWNFSKLAYNFFKLSSNFNTFSTNFNKLPSKFSQF